MHLAGVLGMALTLSGCAVANDVADQLARDRAKSVVNSVVARNLPGVDAAPVTDCIIDAATASEIIAIAGDSVTGVTDTTAAKVLDIAQRPQAVECIASVAISGLLR
ncbi:succinate dehydrogenase [Primorskyibacter marinus]|uniref:succinate dehydrogenase n=1 Tax=Primorskyibacter marinus TaxID=1977320 RepID=UPI000E305F23|nr:succinate dehydrogenase [Primorskyibacter marinus]